MGEQYSYCGHQVTLMKIIGLWPLQTRSYLIRWLACIFGYLEMITLFVCTLGLSGGALFSSNLKQISSTVDILTLTASALYKMAFMSVHINRFCRLVASMDRKFKLLFRNKRGACLNVEYDSRRCALYSDLFVASGFLTCLFYSLLPRLEEGAFVETVYENSTGIYRKVQHYPLEFWLPFQSTSNIVYVCIYLIQSYGLVGSAFIYLVNDAFLFMMIYQIVLQMRGLCLILINLGRGDEDFEVDDDNEYTEIRPSVPNGNTEENSASTPKDTTKLNAYDDEYFASSTRLYCEDFLVAKLKRCMKFHSHLLGMMIEIEELYRSMILADVMHAIISLSFALFDTGASDTIYESVTKNMFLVICILHQFLNSYYGEMFLQAQIDVGEAVYMSDWVHGSEKYRKYVIMILLRSKKHTILSGGKLYNLCRPSFVMFLKSMFSYYMVLRKSSEEHKQTA